MSDHLCPRCGKPLTPGAAACADCSRPHDIRRLGQQPLVWVSVVAIAAALWTVAHFLTRAFVARQDHLARQWFQNGQTDLGAGHLDAAVTDFRTALAYSHENFTYRLRLAQALVAAHQPRQAQAYLHALWDEEPGNGTVNLELARLAAASGDFTAALRYYHGAIYGFWNQDPVRQRREAHLELVQFLLQQKVTQRAESELIALAADLPRDPGLLVRVGGLFQDAGQYARALGEYRDALEVEPRNPAALAGAGAAAFQLQHYLEARRYLRRAVAASPNDSASANLLRITDLVLQMDPFARRLSLEERSRRVVNALNQAKTRMEQCASQRGFALELAPQQKAPQPAGQQTKPATGSGPQAALQADYADLLQLNKRFSTRQLRREPDLADTAIDLVDRAERDAAQLCGPPATGDYALMLIARQREGAEQ